jgi:hypothetical protein
MLSEKGTGYRALGVGEQGCGRFVVPTLASHAARGTRRVVLERETNGVDHKTIGHDEGREAGPAVLDGGDEGEVEQGSLAAI